MFAAALTLQLVLAIIMELVLLEEQFKEDLADILEVDSAVLVTDYKLEDSEMWDSMGIVSTIALIDELYGFTVSGQSLSDSKSFGDLTDLISAARQ